MSAALLTDLTIFILALLIGIEVIGKVPATLHTPLMSATNAISAIAVVGAILVAGEGQSATSTLLGAIAVASAMTNIVGGFLITDRMLKMFTHKKDAKAAPAAPGSER